VLVSVSLVVLIELSRPTTYIVTLLLLFMIK